MQNDADLKKSAASNLVFLIKIPCMSKVHESEISKIEVLHNTENLFTDMWTKWRQP